MCQGKILSIYFPLAGYSRHNLEIYGYKYHMALPVIVCIGSVGVVGDALGPLVGDLLRDKYQVPAYVYGGVKHPVNGINYPLYCAHLKKMHPKSLVIAVDACVGDVKDVGSVKYTARGLKAGEALNKNLGSIGDIGVMGVVAPRSNNNLVSLMSTPYSLVEKMSEKIAYKINSMLTCPFGR